MPLDPSDREALASAFTQADLDERLATAPQVTGGLARDRDSHGRFWQQALRLVERLPPKPGRTEAQAAAADAVSRLARDTRDAFLRNHVGAVCFELTQGFSRHLRIAELVAAAAEAFPGLVPPRSALDAEAGRRLAEKEGLEIDQGIFLSHVLGDEQAGTHLCHAMLLPLARTAEHLARFARDGTIDLGAVRLERRGRSVHLETRNPRFLNAEDQTTLEAMEIAVDVATLDPASDIAVMRGGAIDHPKYRGRRVFGSGINLTHLYRGEIPFLWFLERDLGPVHKLLRGVARPEALPDDVHGCGIEKPWVAAVDGFAIGGHCQVLLTMDYVLAADDAFLALPARKEGIVPGAANLRLPRFVGDRLARQLVQYERKLPCGSAEGRLICDEVVPAAGMDAAIERVVLGLTRSGAVSAIGNRRAFRVEQEPLDRFRRYFAVYAREQAFCHFSPALIANLERNWNARTRAAP